MENINKLNAALVKALEKKGDARNLKYLLKAIDTTQGVKAIDTTQGVKNEQSNLVSKGVLDHLCELDLTDKQKKMSADNQNKINEESLEAFIQLFLSFLDAIKECFEQAKEEGEVKEFLELKNIDETLKGAEKQIRGLRKQPNLAIKVQESLIPVRDAAKQARKDADLAKQASANAQAVGMDRSGLNRPFNTQSPAAPHQGRRPNASEDLSRQLPDEHTVAAPRKKVDREMELRNLEPLNAPVGSGPVKKTPADNTEQRELIAENARLLLERKSMQIQIAKLEADIVRYLALQKGKGSKKPDSTQKPVSADSKRDTELALMREQNEALQQQVDEVLTRGDIPKKQHDELMEEYLKELEARKKAEQDAADWKKYAEELANSERGQGNVPDDKSEDLNQQLQDATESVRELSASMQEQERLVQQYKAHSDTVEKERDKFKDENARLNGILEAAKRDNRGLLDKLETATKENKVFNDQLGRVKSERDELNARLNKLNEAFAAMDKDYQLLQKAHQREKEHNRELAGRLETADALVESSQQASERLLNTNIALEDRLNAAESAHDKARNRARIAEEANGRTMNQLMAESKAHADAEAQLADLRAQLEQERAQLAQERRQRAAAEAERQRERQRFQDELNTERTNHGATQRQLADAAAALAAEQQAHVAVQGQLAAAGAALAAEHQAHVAVQGQLAAAGAALAAEQQAHVATQVQLAAAGAALIAEQNQRQIAEAARVAAVGDLAAERLAHGVTRADRDALRVELDAARGDALRWREHVQLSQGQKGPFTTIPPSAIPGKGRR